ncbi:alpha-N-acetyl-neuraminyl-2,3-beta-galactosyl-1,3-N-acetyl-galactosaminide alpha-2,6-sialyltransferase-like [Ptychodera flava]|uniref:alpha-N-acetyl-neuraminyl-2,3-beta-galactosyl-1, 3-N-acetyl-galactosaminide alpha-2,6-sialyltransferase-like n=1 Tax=Ptychodera flava TaxID=63121 RepID=UPI00396A2148
MTSRKKRVAVVIVLLTVQCGIMIYTLTRHNRHVSVKETNDNIRVHYSIDPPKNYSERCMNSTAVCTETPKDISQSEGIWTGLKDDLSAYSSITNRSKHLDIHCDVCAVVSSSGQLLGSKAGTEIDNATCVIRMNIAPTKGFEVDVGTRTSVRIAGFLGMTRGIFKSTKFFENERFPGKVVIWTNKNGNLVKEESLELIKHHAGLDMYMTSDEHVEFCEALFQKETGRNREKSKSWLSTGWFTMIFALKVCDKVKVYGMIDFDHCSRNKTRSKDVPYHYYDKTEVKECDVSNAGETRSTGGHRYLTEKYVFRKWAKSADMEFFYPSWNITSELHKLPIFLNSAASK